MRRSFYECLFSVRFFFTNIICSYSFVNLVIHFVGMIQDKLPQGVTLFALRLHETPTSYAEWCFEDNQ